MKVLELAIYPYITKKYNSMFDDFIKKNKITQIEIDVLAFLANNPEYQHAQDIVDIRGISKAHASIAIEKLVKKGYVTRQCDPHNRRCNILLVTQDAKEVVKEIRKIQEEYKKTAFADLSSEEKETYLKRLKKIYVNLGGYDNE